MAVASAVNSIKRMHPIHKQDRRVHHRQIEDFDHDIPDLTHTVAIDRSQYFQSGIYTSYQCYKMQL